MSIPSTTATGNDLLTRERQVRHQGSGINAGDVIGCWQLQTIWPKGRSEANAFNGWLLRSLGACLEIREAGDDHLRLRNAVNLGPVTLQFSGPGELSGGRPLLSFHFEQVRLTLGAITLLQRSLPAPAAKRKPFFALIHRDAAGWLAARGRGGGLALWTLRD